MRLDKIPVGSVITWTDSKYDFEDKAIFLGITGQGDDRRANMISKSSSGSTYEWNVYRYNGRWSYGSSADIFRVVNYEEVL